FDGAGEQVSRTVDGADDPRVFGIIPELLPQPRDPDVDAAIECVLGGAARIEQMLAREHSVGGADEQLEHLRLGPAAAGALAPGRGQRERVDVEAPPGKAGDRVRLGGPAHPPEHAVDPRDQLARLERLDDVIVRADLQPHDAVGDVPPAGDGEDGDAAVLELLDQVQPVAVGEAEVDDAGGRPGRLDALHQIRAAPRVTTVELKGSQRLDDELRPLLVILDHDDELAGGRHGCALDRARASSALPNGLRRTSFSSNQSYPLDKNWANPLMSTILIPGTS